jgi:Fe-S oxidoreductase
MTKIKAEFLQHYYDIHGIPFRTWLIAWLPRIDKLAMIFSPVANLMTGSTLFKKIIGFASERKIPGLSEMTLTRWRKRHLHANNEQAGKAGKVYLFTDEFTNYNEIDIGIKTILLLEKLGYDVVIPFHIESGRTFLSKGLLKAAKKTADRNIRLLKEIVSVETPLVGIEPSAILTFRDEYPELADAGLVDDAGKLGRNALLIEEFICSEVDKGKIVPSQFTERSGHILFHGHCQQKAISSTSFTKKMLSLPVNYNVEEIPSGCCGMAGSFGYEKEHYELSMKIGEMILFPAVRSADANTIIAASGTSCRNQIADGTGRKALHPVEIMYDALRDMKIN